MTDPLLSQHKLLVANRGEIAVRILRTAKRLGLRTIAVYTVVDATSPHVLLADEAVELLPLRSDPDGSGQNAASDAKAYLDADAVVNVCVGHQVTLVHPGYGFLSENARFSRLLADRGILLLGPDAKTIENMGLKHRARDLATQAGVPVVPGSDGLVECVEDAVEVTQRIGFPVMLKATAGGGGMGLVVCRDLDALHEKFVATQRRAKSMFGNDGIFMEKFYDASRHIEVQIFGNGRNHVIHIGERECSVQRRHQKIIEEAPSPYLLSRKELREEICESAVRLGKLVNYKSAGTVEFLVDDVSGEFYFLEMNTRLQVEHGITEMLHPGLDIVELMIFQGAYDHRYKAAASSSEPGLPPTFLAQERFRNPQENAHAIEARLYCENPARNFAPSPGTLQYVEFPDQIEGIRIDTWVSTGMVISPFYDPLIAKLMVKGTSRDESITQLRSILSSEDESSESHSRVIVQGPPNNIPFLVGVLEEQTFKEGKATTEWIDRGGVHYTPNAMSIVSPGVHASVQALPFRDIGLGIPPSGPMDPLAFQAGNAILGNPLDCESLELVIPAIDPAHSSSLCFSAIFHVQTEIAVTGANATLQIDGADIPTWSKLTIHEGARLVIGGLRPGDDTSRGGLRSYLSVLGGFLGIPEYLNSKSTSMGSGGYQGRALQSGDMLEIRPSTRPFDATTPLPRSIIPNYCSNWDLYSLPGPHDDTEFLTAAGIESFYSRKWIVSSATNRMGIRLDPIKEQDGSIPSLQWARQNGGEGGSHPSNILDNGYARGSVNLNGDTPVILTNEGPSMGGYLCIATIATADQWKLGQLRPGDILRFKRITSSDAMELQGHVDKWLETVLAISSGFSTRSCSLMDFSPSSDPSHDPKLHYIPASASRPKVVYRQAGDSAILVEYGEMTLDFSIRARIHGLQTAARQMEIPGIKDFCPCIRSTMIHYDPHLISQSDVLSLLIRVEESLPAAIEDMEFPGRRLTFPIVLDDKWCRDALTRYMQSSRKKAVYLPSNIEYLARNNGVEGGIKGALQMLVSSPWLVFGVGFYLACPFLVPIDPRCRLVGQKMNPSRTFTPRGAVGIAGLVAAIYPVESPGGYQLFGRTLPTWQPWGKGPDFAPHKPWLLEPFDQVVFEPVSEEYYSQLEKEFDSGRYVFKIDQVVFSMKEHLSFLSSIKDEIHAFKLHQSQGVALEEARESILLKEWLDSKHTTGSDDVPAEDTKETENFVTALLSGTVWKVNVNIGDAVTSSDQVLLILEAMKTEINLTAGEENVGLKVFSFAKGIKEGAVVQAGDKLVFLDK